MSDMLSPLPIISRKAVVPDFATVPRFLISSALVIPTPVSVIEIVFASNNKNKIAEIQQLLPALRKKLRKLSGPVAGVLTTSWT